MARTKKSGRTGFRAKSKQGREIRERLQQQPKAILCTVCGKADGKYKCPKCRAPFCCVKCSKEHKANHCTAVKTDDAAVASTDSSATTTNNNNNAQSSDYLSKQELTSSTTTTTNDHNPRKKRIRAERDEDSDDDDEPGWNITPEMKKLVHQSTWLRKELRDGGLRQLIGRIDAASDDEEEEGGGGDIRKNNNTNRRNGRHDHCRGNNKYGVTPRELALARTKHSHDKFASFIDRMLLTTGVLQTAEGAGDDIASILEGGHGPLVMTPVPRPGGAMMDGKDDEEEEGSGTESASSSSDGSTSTSDDDDSDDSDSSDDCE